MTELSPEMKEAIEKARNREQWLRYDSIVIGPGAKEATPTWFNTMAEFANTRELIWFTSTRDRQAGPAYNNVASGGQENFGQLVYQTGIEFIAPPGTLQYETESIDSDLLGKFFLQELPRRMAFSVKLQDTDQILEVPGIHLPAGVGTTGTNVSAAGALTSVQGQTGDASLRATWTWPDPIVVPANRKLGVSAIIDRPIAQFLQQLNASPGSKVVPVPVVSASAIELRDVTYPNWYVIRIWHRGPRFVQLRGAYSASGTV